MSKDMYKGKGRLDPFRVLQLLACYKIHILNLLRSMNRYNLIIKPRIHGEFNQQCLGHRQPLFSGFIQATTIMQQSKVETYY